MLPFLFTESFINLNLSLQWTCDTVWRSQGIVWTCWERRGGRQLTWLSCLCQMSRSKSWYSMLVYRKSTRVHNHAHTDTHTHKVSRLCHFSHGRFLRRLSLQQHSQCKSESCYCFRCQQRYRQSVTNIFVHCCTFTTKTGEMNAELLQDTFIIHMQLLFV
jgi:hypothetical protein